MKKIFFVLLLVFMLTACKNNSSSKSLDAPINLAFSGETLSWDVVEDATYYTVYVEDVKVETVDSQILLIDFDNGNYDLKVMANSATSTSAYSEILQITINRQFDIPQNLSFEDSLVSFSTVENALSYNITINDELINVLTNTYFLVTSPNKVYEITVQAVFERGESVQSSIKSFHTYDRANSTYYVEFNRLLTIGLDIVLEEEITLEAFYINNLNYLTSYIEIDGQKLTFDNNLLTLLAIGQQRITLITEDSRIDIVLTIIEDDKPTLISSEEIDYIGQDITFKFALFDGDFSVISGADIGDEDYVINGDELTIKSTFIDDLLVLDPNRRTVILSYVLALGEDKTIGYLFIVTEDY